LAPQWVQLFFHLQDRAPDPVHRKYKVVPRDAEFLNPVVDVVIILEVDEARVPRCAFRLLIGHGVSFSIIQETEPRGAWFPPERRDARRR
jgi:hypothetical protein